MINLLIMNSKQFNNKERIVKKVFDEVSDKYDFMNDIMSLGIHRIWKKNFISLLNPQKNTKLIDVASGTGDIAKLYLDRISFEGKAYCVDENIEMLKLNEKKNNQTKNIKCFCNEAEKLPFPDNYFNYYTVSFGIRNVKNINSTLKEAYRVLKTGGRFICLEFSKVELRGYLDAKGQDFREDETNQDVAVTRNRIRHELIPFLERRFSPRIVDTLIRETKIARQDASWLEKQAKAAAEAVIERLSR